MSTLDEVYKIADDLGLIVNSFILDGDWQRVPVTGKRKSNKSGAYCLSEFRLRNGDMVIVGMLANHVSGREERITLDGIDGVSEEELAEAKQRAREAAEKAKQDRLQLQAETAKRAQSIWDKLPDTGRSEYLDKKRVKAYGVRFSRGSIVVPACDIDDKLWTLQFIQPDGSKRFLTGGAKRARFHYIKRRVASPLSSIIGIAEGYATGATLYDAFGQAVSMAIAFDAGNLLPVGEALRSRYPDARLVFFADHDRHGGYPQAFIRQRDISPVVREQIDRLARVRPDVVVEVVADDDPRLSDKDRHYNTGVTRALLAAAAVDGDVVVPRFDPVEGGANE